MDHEEQDELLFVYDALDNSNLTCTEETLNHQDNILSNEERNCPELWWTLSGDPDRFERSYANLKAFIKRGLDTNKDELIVILYPIFVRMYLELVYNEHSLLASTFLTKFGPEQDPYYQNDLQKLAMINSKDLMTVKKLDDCFNLSKFLIPISQGSWYQLCRYLQVQKEMFLLHIIKVYMNIDIYKETFKMVTSNEAINQPIRQSNKEKLNNVISNSAQSRQSEAMLSIEETEHNERDTLKKKMRASSPSILFDTTRKDQPPTNYISIIDLKLISENKKLLKSREFRVKALPSIFTHTLYSSKRELICATFSEDASMLSLGFQNGLIQVWSLTSKKLKLLKLFQDAKQRMLDEESGESVRNLLGHMGPILSVTLSPDAIHLLSCSQDKTIRLWSLAVWECIFLYDTPGFPTWDVKFSPCSYYFASASSDKTAKLWAIEYKNPLRIFKGHFSDVDCIQFHPNSKYIATSSCDFQIILWNYFTGNNIYVLTGHKSVIYSLAFSPCGRFLVSGSSDLNILIWNIASGRLITVLNGHKNKITDLAFSRCGSWLSSGSLDCTLKLWDFARLSEDLLKKNTITENKHLIATYAINMSPFVAVHFSKDKLLTINFSQSQTK